MNKDEKWGEVSLLTYTVGDFDLLVVGYDLLAMVLSELMRKEKLN